MTELELRDRGRSLAGIVQDIKAEEGRQASQKAQMKERLAELAAQQAQLAIVISRGEEDRDVRCQVVYNYHAMQVEVVREDLGEVVSKRRMTEDELQRPLEL